MKCSRNLTNIWNFGGMLTRTWREICQFGEVQWKVDLKDKSRKIVNILKTQGFFGPEYIIEIDHAHRLGKREEDKTRPIIVRFSFYKDKEVVLKKGILFKGWNITASQDFFKITLGIHKQLRAYAKHAKDTFNNDEN